MNQRMIFRRLTTVLWCGLLLGHLHSFGQLALVRSKLQDIPNQWKASDELYKYVTVTCADSSLATIKTILEDSYFNEKKLVTERLLYAVLMKASYLGDLEFAKYLIARGATSNITLQKRENGTISIMTLNRRDESHLLYFNPDDYPNQKVYIKKDEIVTYDDPFLTACGEGHLKLVTYFHEIGLPKTILASDGGMYVESGKEEARKRKYQRSFMVACHFDQLEVAQFLLSKGANIHFRADSDYQHMHWRGNALHYAVSGGAKRCFEWLYKNGVSIQNTDGRGRSIMHQATRPEARYLIPTLILMYGCNPNSVTGYGGAETPLALAAERGDTATYRLLLFHGADPTISNDWKGQMSYQLFSDSTSREIAEKWGNADLEKLFPSQKWTYWNERAIATLKQNQYLAARIFAEAALQKVETELGKKYTSYQQAVALAAVCNQKASRFRRSEELYELYLDELAKTVGAHTIPFARGLYYLASLYSEWQEKDRAVIMLKASTQILKTAKAKNSPEYALVRGLMMQLRAYNYVRDNQINSEYDSVRTLQKSLFGETHPEYLKTNFAKPLGALEQVLHGTGGYSGLGDPGDFSHMFVRPTGATLKKNMLAAPVNRLDEAYCWATYDVMAPDTSTARLEILKINALNDFRASAGNLKAIEEIIIGARKQAEQVKTEFGWRIVCNRIRSVVDPVRRNVGKIHPVYALILSSLKEYTYPEADSLSEEMALVSAALGKMPLPIFSDATHRALLNDITAYRNEQTRFYLHWAVQLPELTGPLYEEILGQKNRILLSEQTFRETFIKRDQYSTRAVLEGMSSVQQLSQKYAQSLAYQWLDLVGTLFDAFKPLQHQFGSIQPNLALWERVRNRLKPGEVAIEYFHYRFPVKSSGQEPDQYYAILIRPDSEQPRLVSLSTPHDQSNQPPGFIEKRKRGSIVLSSKSNQQNIVGHPYQRCWEPLTQYLQPQDTVVYYALSGLLHSISFASIRDTSGTLLSTRYQLHLMTKTDLLLPALTPGTPARKTGEIKTAQLFGNVKYGKAGKIDPLPLTKKEVDDIQTVLEKAGMQSTVFIGEKASEQNLKIAWSDPKASPYIAHITTHGFFNRIPPTAPQTDPLLRSGLYMAGAEKAFDRPVTYRDTDDGILTAWEISMCNFKSTELVALSACETNLGDVRDVEGVFGLTRAFKLAGARYVMASLWRVDAASTVDFMVDFYKNWITNKQEIRQAFIHTQRRMSQKYAYDSTKWAAFVLIE